MTFENLKCSIVIISSVSIVFDISIIWLIIDVVCIFIRFRVGVISLIGISSKIIPQCRILIISHGFEFSIGEEAIDHSEHIIGKAEDGICIDVAVKRCKSAWIFSVLDRREKEAHEGNCEKNSYEDEEHQNLIAALVLDHVQNEDKD